MKLKPNTFAENAEIYISEEFIETIKENDTFEKYQ